MPWKGDIRYMSPEKAKVFVTEDDERFQKIIKRYLEEAGHSVIATATNLDQALAMVDQLEQLGVDVAVLDGNLDKDDVSGYDGRTVLEAIREKTPRVKTIGMSGNSVKGTDVDLGKLNAHDLGKVIKDL